MAKETVQAIRQAELNAAQKEKYANQKSETIILEAEQNAKMMIMTMTKEAQDKADHNLSLANQRAAEIMNNVKMKADKEVGIMNELAKGKEEAAIKLVLSRIVNDK